MLTPEERGPHAAWAYEARDLLEITPEQVVLLLPRPRPSKVYDPATIRKAETSDRHMSRPLWRALTALYPKLAHEKGITIPFPPGSMAGSDKGRLRDQSDPADLSELYDKLDAQADAINRQAKAIEALTKWLGSLMPDAIRRGVEQALEEARDLGDGESPDEPLP